MVVGAIVVTNGSVVVGTATVVVVESEAVVVVSVVPEEQPVANTAATANSMVTRFMSSPLATSTLPSVSADDLHTRVCRLLSGLHYQILMLRIGGITRTVRH